MSSIQKHQAVRSPLVRDQPSAPVGLDTADVDFCSPVDRWWVTWETIPREVIAAFGGQTVVGSHLVGQADCSAQTRRRRRDGTYYKHVDIWQLSEGAFRRSRLEWELAGESPTRLHRTKQIRVAEDHVHRLKLGSLKHDKRSVPVDGRGAAKQGVSGGDAAVTDLGDGSYLPLGVRK